MLRKKSHREKQVLRLSKVPQKQHPDGSMSRSQSNKTESLMGSSRMDMKFTLKATASATWGINPHTDPAAKDETVGTGSKRRLESLG